VSAHACAGASAASEKRFYAIDEGSLVSVLNRFAEQAGIFLAGHNDLATDKRSTGLNGEFTEQQGLQQMLQGSGLQNLPLGTRSYVLKALQAGPLDRDTTNISGQTPGAITEDSHAYTTASTSSATGLRLSLRETP